MWPRASVSSNVGLALLALLRFSHGGMLPVEYTASPSMLKDHNSTWAEYLQDSIAIHRRQAAVAAWQPSNGCPGYDGQEVISPSGLSVYRIYCNTDQDAAGNVLAEQENLADCINWSEAEDRCSDDACTGVVYAISTRTCYSKGLGGSTTTGTNVVYARYVRPYVSPTTTTAAGTATTCATTPTAIAVTFRLAVVTSFGEGMFVTGSLPQLGNWSPYSGLALNSSQYTDANPIWVGTVTIAAGTTIAYKYVKSSNGNLIWEDDPNRSYTVVANCAGAVTISTENFNRTAPVISSSVPATTVTTTVTTTRVWVSTITSTVPIIVTSTSTQTVVVSSTQTVAATRTTTLADSTVTATSTQVVSTTVTVISTIVVTATSTSSPVTTTTVATTILTTALATTTVQNTQRQTATTTVNPTRTVNPTVRYQVTSTVRSA